MLRRHQCCPGCGQFCTQVCITFNCNCSVMLMFQFCSVFQDGFLHTSAEAVGRPSARFTECVCNCCFGEWMCACGVFKRRGIVLYLLMRAACTRVVSMWLVMQGAWPPIICRVSQSSWAVASRPAANLPHVISTSVSIWWYDDDRASSTSVEPAMLIQQSTTSTKVVRCLRTIRTTVHIVTWKLTWKMSLCRQRSHIHCLVLRSTLTTSSHWGTTYTLSQLCELFLIIVTLVCCLCDCSIWGLMRAPHYWWLCFLDWELILYSILILLLFLLLLGDHFNKAQSSVVLNRIRMKFVYCQLESAYAACCWLLCSSVCQFLTYRTFILLIMKPL